MKCEWVNNHETLHSGIAYQDHNLIMENKYMKIRILLSRKRQSQNVQKLKQLKLWNNDTVVHQCSDV